MSFDTMMERATDSTITIAVAADSPPTKTTIATRLEPAASGSVSTNMSLFTRPSGKVKRPASVMGITNRLMSTR